MLSLLTNLWKHIRQGENIELYLTVLVAIPLAILNLLGVAQSWAAPITLAVLALFGVSTLVNRQRLESILEKLSQSSDSVLLDKFPPSREEDLKNAKELWLIGIALNKTVNTHYPVIQEKLKRGGSIKVLVVDPDGTASTLRRKRG